MTLKQRKRTAEQKRLRRERSATRIRRMRLRPVPKSEWLVSIYYESTDPRSRKRFDAYLKERAGRAPKKATYWKPTKNFIRVYSYATKSAAQAASARIARVPASAKEDFVAMRGFVENPAEKVKKINRQILADKKRVS